MIPRWDGRAATLGVRAPAAERVELCVRPAGHDGPEQRVDLALDEGDDGRWSLTTDRLAPGDRYGFRVHGPGANPNRLLLDPGSLAVEGEIDWAHVDFGDAAADTGPWVPWSVLVDPTTDWSTDRRPAVAPADRVIYEANVRSLTARHPAVRPSEQGTYLGAAHPAVIEHLVGLGVTTLELLPVQHFVTGRAQWSHGLRNLWGYDPVAWCAPHGGYATADDGRQVEELQALVRAVHAAGIEVVLDVVFNHTGEYDAHGPTITLRGYDDAGWYRHQPDGSYEDTTGCRNSVDLRPEANRAFVVACLRHWATAFHVDGFRFDLASTLIRGDHGPDLASPLLADMAADPVLAGCALIAEPWDALGDGYRLGAFPARWAEWNDRFRDDVRDVWRGVTGTRGRLATRLAGSSDVFAPPRTPIASINFVTAHDGFTLADLVAYEHRRNDANGEGGHDGASDNRSWNCGVEGPTDDPAVRALRARQVRNLLATLLVARGVPMLVAGDELGRTQGGNNNAYCQDNEVSWIDWDHADRDLVAFVAHAVEVRRSRPELRADAWLNDGEVAWREADGQPIADEAWGDGDRAVLVMALAETVVVVNAGPADASVVLPDTSSWARVLDSGRPDGRPDDPWPVAAGGTVAVPGRTVLVMATPDPEPA